MLQENLPWNLKFLANNKHDKLKWLMQNIFSDVDINFGVEKSNNETITCAWTRKQNLKQKY